MWLHWTNTGSAVLPIGLLLYELSKTADSITDDLSNEQSLQEIGRLAKDMILLGKRQGYWHRAGNVPADKTKKRRSLETGQKPSSRPCPKELILMDLPPQTNLL